MEVRENCYFRLCFLTRHLSGQLKGSSGHLKGLAAVPDLSFCLCCSTAMQLDVCTLCHLSKDLAAVDLYPASLSRVWIKCSGGLLPIAVLARRDNTDTTKQIIHPPNIVLIIPNDSLCVRLLLLSQSKSKCTGVNRAEKQRYSFQP